MPEEKNLQPAFAHYQEWIGYEPFVQPHTLANMRTSMEAQGGDLNDVVATVMYFKSEFHGYLYVANAPLKSNMDLKRRKMI